MPQKNILLLATHNPGKIREFSRLLAPLGAAVIGLNQFPDLPVPEETGRDFLENALIKAAHACAGTGFVALADDSGLTVEALHNLPGIYSARFGLITDACLAAGTDAIRHAVQNMPHNAPDSLNKERILALLQGIPPEKRRCRYVCAIAVAAPNGMRISAEGYWDGYILESPRGRNGFGYDPLFFDPILGISAAEMPPEEKNARSHRSAALRRLLEIWPTGVFGTL